MTTVLPPRPESTQASGAAADTAVVRELLDATAHHGGDVRGTIDRIGVERTVEVVLDEIVFRACPGDFTLVGGEPADVTLRLRHGGRAVSRTISVGPAGVTVGTDPCADLPGPVIQQDLAEVAVALYGPDELRTTATRSIEWPGPEIVFPTPDRPFLPTVYYALPQRVYQVLDREEPADLAELSVRYGTDKWGAMHRYPRDYERHFAPRRGHRLSVLEIGIGGWDAPDQGGGSLRVWKRFFPRALVHGVDIVDKHLVDEARMTTIQADQSRTDQLQEIVERYGPFDIVIDDGSHVPAHVVGTFGVLFPHVRPGGLYVIEDLMTSYWPEVFSGTDDDLDNPAFTIGLLKSMLDGLHHQELLRPEVRAALPSDTAISGVHVYHNLAVLEKAPNNDQSMVADMMRAGRAGGGQGHGGQE